MARHAILVVTFGDASVFKRLAWLLDDPDIDLSLHVDRRTPREPYLAAADDLQDSQMIFATRRRAPTWGSNRFVRKAGRASRRLRATKSTPRSYAEPRQTRRGVSPSRVRLSRQTNQPIGQR